jgi:hypothetical protein
MSGGYRLKVMGAELLLIGVWRQIDAPWRQRPAVHPHGRSAQSRGGDPMLFDRLLKLAAVAAVGAPGMGQA